MTILKTIELGDATLHAQELCGGVRIIDIQCVAHTTADIDALRDALVQLRPYLPHADGSPPMPKAGDPPRYEPQAVEAESNHALGNSIRRQGELHAADVARLERMIEAHDKRLSALELRAEAPAEPPW